MKMLNIIIHQGNENQDHQEILFTVTKMAVIKNLTIMMKIWRNWNLYTLLVETAEKQAVPQRLNIVSL